MYTAANSWHPEPSRKSDNMAGLEAVMYHTFQVQPSMPTKHACVSACR